MKKDSFIKSSIGRKVIMALTGAALAGFVIVHMLGNLQIFLGPEALNSYAEHLEELTMLLWPARIFLLIALMVHIFVALSLAIENKKARPIVYQSQNTVQASYASRTMVFSGLIIFAFIVYHLLHFTFKFTNPGISNLVDAKGRDDVYSMVVLSFQSVQITTAYIISMVLLCYHLSHGLPSLFQSLGLSGVKCDALLKKIGKGIALVIFIGNCSIPLAAYLHFLNVPKGAAG